MCHVLGRDGPCRKNVRIAPVVARWDQWQRDREQSYKDPSVTDLHTLRDKPIRIHYEEKSGKGEL